LRSLGRGARKYYWSKEQEEVRPLNNVFKATGTGPAPTLPDHSI
jgi:hypothetical protein